MVFNGTSGQLYNIEQNLRDFCDEKANHQCTVFAVFDMCKDVKTRYAELTLKADKELKGTAKAARG